MNSEQLLFGYQVAGGRFFSDQFFNLTLDIFTPAKILGRTQVLLAQGRRFLNSFFA